MVIFDQNLYKDYLRIIPPPPKKQNASSMPIKWMGYTFTIESFQDNYNIVIGISFTVPH